MLTLWTLFQVKSLCCAFWAMTMYIWNTGVDFLDVTTSSKDQHTIFPHPKYAKGKLVIALSTLWGAADGHRHQYLGSDYRLMSIAGVSSSHHVGALPLPSLSPTTCPLINAHFLLRRMMLYSRLLLVIIAHVSQVLLCVGSYMSSSILAC